MKKSKYQLTPLQKAWLKALKSGKYRKGISRLCSIDKHNNKNYCCLGVACVVYNKHSKSPLVADTNKKVLSFGGEELDIPEPVREELKLRRFHCDDNYPSPITMNDELSWSHKKIAKFIEKYPEKFFY